MSLALSGLHHVGISVRDLNASLQWYERVLGVTPVSSGRADGPGFSAAVSVPEAVTAWALLEIGSTKLELLEYERPRGEDFALRNCDIGAIHVAFSVENIAEAFALLQEMNVELAAPPVFDADEHYLYFRDPDGIQLELYSTP